MKKRNKGFTLVEMVISMTVTLVLVSLISSLVYVVSKNVVKSNHNNEIYTQLTLCKDKISGWYNEIVALDDFEDKYAFVVIGDNDEILNGNYGGKVCLYEKNSSTGNGLNETPLVSMYFDKSDNTLYCTNKSASLKLDDFDDIKFKIIDDGIKVKLTYDGGKTAIMLLIPEAI